MFIRSKSRSTRGYTIYAIAGTILDVLALLIVMVVILPLFNIHLEWWIIAVALVVELTISLFTYLMGRRALRKRLRLGPEAIIGSEGMVTTLFNPTGYIKVRGELWNASCHYKVEIGDEVVVTGMEGMKLIVVPNVKDNSRLSRK